VDSWPTGAKGSSLGDAGAGEHDGVGEGLGFGDCEGDGEGLAFGDCEGDGEGGPDEEGDGEGEGVAGIVPDGQANGVVVGDGVGVAPFPDPLVYEGVVAGGNVVGGGVVGGGVFDGVGSGSEVLGMSSIACSVRSARSAGRVVYPGARLAWPSPAAYVKRPRRTSPFPFVKSLKSPSKTLVGATT
jgi:hypothetical protein